MKPLLTSVGMLLALTVIGTVGLRMIEKAPWLDCLFMAVISLTTVGYGETVPLGVVGRWFMMAYLFASTSKAATSASVSRKPICERKA